MAGEPQGSIPPQQPQYGQPQYGRPQGMYPGQQPFLPPNQAMPVRKKGGNGGLVWVLVGCGVLAVVGIVVMAVAITFASKQVTKSDYIRNAGRIPIAQSDLVQVRVALDKYTQTHQGKYPTTLDNVVDESYLSMDSASPGGKMHIEYTPPAATDPGDAPVAGFYMGQMNISIGREVKQRIYIRLLKDGTIVQEQIARSSL